MNAWLLIRRLRGPAFLIMVGITALLNQWGVLSFSRSWPLYLILAGVIGLAERAAMVAAPPMPGVYPAGYAPSAYPPGGSYPGPNPQTPPAPGNQPLVDPDRRP
jgi:Domain of unknown function (DUF5668)